MSGNYGAGSSPPGPTPAQHAATVLSAETVKQLRDAGPKDLLWLICDSHELLRARCEQQDREAETYSEMAESELTALRDRCEQLRDRCEQLHRERYQWEFIAAERGTRMDEIQIRAEAAERRVAALETALREALANIGHGIRCRCDICAPLRAALEGETP